MASSTITTADDLKECPICLEEMFNKGPKLLNCKHSFCTPCLARLDTAQTSTDPTLVCPVCKYKTPLPSGRVDRLPDNFLLLDIKSVLDQVAERRGHFCFYCDKFDKYVTASVECLDCQRYLCTLCLERHNENSMFKSHDTRILSPEHSRSMCKEHNEHVLYVCTTCDPNRMFCDVCMIAGNVCQHGDNLTKSEDVSLQRARENLSSLFSQKKLVQKSLEQTLSYVEKQEKLIEKHKEAMIQAIEENSQSTLDAIREASNVDIIRLAAEHLYIVCENASLTLETDESINTVNSITGEAEEAFKNFFTERSKGKEIHFVPGAIPSFGSLKDATEVQIQQTVGTDAESPKEELNMPPESTVAWPLEPGMKDSNLNYVSRKPVATSFNRIRPGRSGSIFYVNSGNHNVHEVTPQGKITWDINTNTGLAVTRCHIDTYGEHVFVYKHFGGYDYFTKLKMPRNKKISTRCSGEKECHDPVFNFCALDDDTLVYITECGLRKYLYTPQAAFPICNDNTLLSDDVHPLILNLRGLVTWADFALVYPTTKTILIYDIDGELKNKIQLDCKGKLSATINESGNFLVADSDTCRVSEFTAEGCHVRDLLTRNNGIFWPVGLVYSAPYLWLLDREGFHEYLKCFR